MAALVGLLDGSSVASISTTRSTPKHRSECPEQMLIGTPMSCDLRAVGNPADGGLDDGA